MASTSEGSLGPEADVDAGHRVRLRLLGAAELEGPAALRFLPERRFRLLAYLALQGGWVPRDQLAHLFWPDRTQEAARNNLRKLLFEVRALGPERLEDSRHAVRWQVDHDVAALVRAHTQKDHRLVLALYRGTALPGLDGGDSAVFATWVRGERLRLRTMWRNSVFATIADATPASTIDHCQRLLEDDPYDEEALRTQMRAFAALGRATDADRAYKAFAERVIEELGVDAALETQTLARELRVEKPKASVSVVGGNAPEVSEGFVGRVVEMAELQALLGDSQCRLVTVTGPGGMGKSRLVKEVIHGRAMHADGAVHWIALDDLTDVAQVAPRVARELGLTTSALQDPAQGVAKHLEALKVLMVFDNSEHLPALGGLVEQWLAAAPGLKILATSRARIGTDREWLVPLQGLQVPAADVEEEVLQSDAARLFVSQATLAQPRFNARREAAAVANLVRAVGGMPLAILLAAGWVRLLPVTDMASDVTHLLDVLERAEEGDERPEHRSVRATVEQSWRLLTSAEQQLLMVLSVFSGTFTRAAVHEVSHAPLPLLGSLVDKSLVQIDGNARCSLHPLIQQFAAQKLAGDAALAVTARDQHADSYSRLMEQFERFNSIDQPAALRTIAAELSNILVAWDWAIARKRGDWLSHCASGLSNYFQAHGPLDVGLKLFARAEAALTDLRAPASDAAWALPLESASLSYWLGDYRAVEVAGRRALAAARERRNAYGIRFSLNTLGLAVLRQGRLTEADRYLSEALKRARAAHLSDEVASFAGNLVGIRRELGADASALALAEEALAAHQMNGHRIGQISMHNELGLILHAAGQPERAVSAYESGLELTEGTWLEARRSGLLSHCASALLDLGDIRRAHELCREALEIMLSSGSVGAQPTCRRNLVAIELSSGNVDAAREQLVEVIAISRRLATPMVTMPTLREGANFLEHLGDLEIAQRMVACANAHRMSDATLIPRYRDTADRLRKRLGRATADRLETEGAALSLDAALEELKRALTARV